MTNRTSLTNPHELDKDESIHASSNKAPLAGEAAVAALKQLSSVDHIKNNIFDERETTLIDPSIDGQQIGLFSFIPARGAKPDENGIYGFAKMRGNYPNDVAANAKAEDIIVNVDSAHTIHHVFVGRPFPITTRTDMAYSEHVDIRKGALTAVADAIRAKNVSEEKKQFALNERTKELLRDSEKPVSTEDVISEGDVNTSEDHYTMLRVKKAQITFAYLEHVKKLKEIKHAIINTRKDIEIMESSNISLFENYFEKYKKARDSVGLDITEESYKEGFLRYLTEDIKLTGVDFNDGLFQELFDDKYGEVETTYALEGTEKKNDEDDDEDDVEDAKFLKAKKQYEDEL